MEFKAGSKRILSPSAVNSYINCPLQFYYRYIARIKEPEEIDEDILSRGNNHTDS